MSQSLKITPFYEYHRGNAKLTAFAGWEMPLWYRGISEEHLAVRNAVGLFDVSHMARVRFTGDDATSFLQRVLPSDVEKVKAGKAFYSVVLNDKGGIIDDIVALKINDTEYLMIVNAANTEKGLNWFKQNSASFAIKIENISPLTAILALQGPKAATVLRKIAGPIIDGLKFFAFTKATIEGFETCISRTGYTGEDGFELIPLVDSTMEQQRLLKVWLRILDVGAAEGIQPCGLGARDTLRLEAGFCLHGQDITENITPLEAGLGRLVNFQKEDFVGKEALLKQSATGTARVRIHAKMKSEGIPRRGYKFFSDNKEIGEVTSGTFSPLLKVGIAMGYIDATVVHPQSISIDVRGRKMAAELVQPPFYDTSRYGQKRQTG